MAIVSADALASAVTWACGELGVRRAKLAAFRVFPWSATARLCTGADQYWVKVGPAANSLIESAILTAARDRHIPAMPRIVGASGRLSALLVRHVPSCERTYSAAALTDLKDQVGARLAAQLGCGAFPRLSMTGCGETIALACRRGPWWASQAAAGRLADTLKRCGEDFLAGDAALRGTGTVLHGDFHPGNVLMSASGPVFIDWADACYGAPAWDHAMFRVAKRDLSPDSRDPDTLAAGILAGLKELSDFAQTPRPEPGAVYTVALDGLRAYVSRRAERLRRSLDLLRAHGRSYVWDSLSRL
ncbi:MAG TPA: aminoglycoside phosphotransferase family protein [Streptosporangiaceae bacterium]|nr:aminoglycoside phosphotransferase family protein [Streptosporangiaceae bacterium]